MKKFAKLKKASGSMLYKRGKSEKLLFSIVFILFFVYAVSLIFPVLWLAASSFKDGIQYELDIIRHKVFSLPDKWMFNNYLTAFATMEVKGTNFLGMMFNSTWRLFFEVGGGVFASALSGYCLAKYKFGVRNIMYASIILSMTLPIVGSSGAFYKLISDLGVYNTPFYSVVIAFGGHGFNFMVLYAFFRNVSWNYAEAVFVDGGGHGTAFFKIMLPQARPVLLTLSIIASIGIWNDYMTPLLYMPDYPMVASGLYIIEKTLTRGSMPVYYAGLCISMIPVLTLFVVFSDKIMSNMTLGGLKG